MPEINEHTVTLGEHSVNALVTFSRRRVSAVAIGISAVFLILHPVAFWIRTSFELDQLGAGLVRLVRVDEEASIPTWWSQMLLLACGILLSYIGLRKKRSGGKTGWLPWAALAAVFVYISIDEGASVHELLATPTIQLLSPGAGIWAWGWYIPMLAALGALILVFARFYFALPTEVKIWFAAALLIYVGGAAGMEMLAALWVSSGGGTEGPRYVMYTGIEEFLEMLGAIAFIHSLMLYISKYLPGSGRVDLQLSK